MCLLSLLYPTTFIEEWLLVVEAVNCFGSGVAGLSVLTHTHTPPWLTSLWLGKMTAIIHAGIFPLSPRLCKNAHALAIHVPSIVVHSHAEGFLPVFRLHAQNLLGFTHVVSSPADLWMMWSYPLRTS